MGSRYFGAIAYVDDINLISSSRSVLQKILNLCVSYTACCGFILKLKTQFVLYKVALV